MPSLEIRLDDRVVYLQDTSTVKMSREDGQLTLTASENGFQGATGGPEAPTGTPLVLPAPAPGAPDGDDEPTEPSEPVIEHVHSGDRIDKPHRRTRAHAHPEPEAHQTTEGETQDA